MKTSFLDSLTTKERYNYRRRARRLLESHQGKVRIARYFAEGDVHQLMDHTEVIASRSYQRSLSVGFSHTDYIRKRLEFEARQGWLRGYVLYIEDKPCAFWIGSLYGDMLYSDYIGFDPFFADSRPGLYLVIQVLEELCGPSAKTQAKRLDFGAGESEWKKAIIGDFGLVETTAHLFAPNIVGQLLRLLWAASEAVNLGGKAILKRSSLLGRVRRKWRERIRPRAQAETEPGS